MAASPASRLPPCRSTVSGRVSAGPAPSGPRRPGGGAQEAGFPLVAIGEGIGHVGAGRLALRGHLGAEQLDEPVEVVDALPEDGLRSTAGAMGRNPAGLDLA